MSRSGNHGVIRWIVSHYEENGYTVHFYNNTVTPFLEHLNFIIPHVDKSVKKVFLVSFEDIVINERFSKLSSIADHNILLVRDPANLFASRIVGLAPDRGISLPNTASATERIAAAEATDKVLPRQIQNYMNHYEEFSGKTNFLANKICINYASWVKKEPYRREIINDRLGLKFSDSRYKNRAGSSFGNPPSSIEEYFDRWKSCWDSFVYDKVRKNPELMRISREFGVCPE